MKVVVEIKRVKQNWQNNYYMETSNKATIENALEFSCTVLVHKSWARFCLKSQAITKELYV